MTKFIIILFGLGLIPLIPYALYLLYPPTYSLSPINNNITIDASKLMHSHTRFQMRNINTSSSSSSSSSSSLEPSSCYSKESSAITCLTLNPSLSSDLCQDSVNKFSTATKDFLKSSRRTATIRSLQFSTTIIAAFEGGTGSATFSQRVDELLAFLEKSLLAKSKANGILMNVIIRREFHVGWKSYMKRRRDSNMLFLNAEDFRMKIPLDFVRIGEIDCDMPGCRDNIYFVLYIPPEDKASNHSVAIINNSSVIEKLDHSKDKSVLDVQSYLESNSQAVRVDRTMHILAINTNHQAFSDKELLVDYWVNIEYRISSLIRIALGLPSDYTDICKSVDVNCEFNNWPFSKPATTRDNAIDSARESVKLSFETESSIIQSWENLPFLACKIEDAFEQTLLNLKLVYELAMRTSISSTAHSLLLIYDSIVTRVLVALEILGSSRNEKASIHVFQALLRVNRILDDSKILLDDPSFIDVNDFPLDQKIAMLAPFWLPLLVPLIRGLRVKR